MNKIIDFWRKQSFFILPVLLYLNSLAIFAGVGMLAALLDIILGMLIAIPICTQIIKEIQEIDNKEDEK